MIQRHCYREFSNIHRDLVKRSEEQDRLYEDYALW